MRFDQTKILPKSFLLNDSDKNLVTAKDSSFKICQNYRKTLNNLKGRLLSKIWMNAMPILMTATFAQ